MALLSAFSKARVRQRVIGSATGISLPVSASLLTATAVSNTVNVAGAKVGDIVAVTVQTPTTGVMVDGYVSSASTVTIRQNNITAGTVATVTATTAQLEVLRP